MLQQTIKHKTHYLELNRRVDVFDHVFSYNWRLMAFNFIQNSAFRIGWADTNVPERRPHGYLIHSKYTQQDVVNLKILDQIQQGEITALLSGLTASKAVVNLSVPSDVNYVHTHYEKKVLLYYVNLEWKEGWHGETIFYSDNLTDIELALPYTPGRLVIFDGDIPHTIRPQSTVAPHYRLTFTLFYNTTGL